MVLALSYCLCSGLFLTNTQVCYCYIELTIARDQWCALKGAMHPVHQNLKFKETWLVIYQMKECDHAHHVLHLKL